MFLLKMEAAEHVGDEFYNFVPYNYGPFDAAIYRDIDVLVLAGLVEKLGGGRWPLYSATESGRERARKLAKTTDKEGIEYLRSVVRWVSSVSFQQLLRSIYAKYPKYAKNSLFRSS